MKIKPVLHTRWRWELALFGSILICVGVLVVSELGHLRLQRGYSLAVREMRASGWLGELQGYLNDAEAGQRGFLLTRRDGYLESYRQAMPKVARLTGQLSEYYKGLGDPGAQLEFSGLITLIGEKNSEMDTTITLVREGRANTAREIMLTDIGKEKMDLIRLRVAGLQQREQQRTATLVGSWEFSRNLSRFSVALVTVLNIVLLVVLFHRLRTEWEEQRLRQQSLLDEQQRLDRLVQQRTRQIAMLASHIQQVSENEKTLIARELHDELGAILTATKMDVAWVRQQLKEGMPPLLSEKLARALKNLDHGVQAKRRIIENLRPSTLTTFGLVMALREHAEQAAERNDWALDLVLPDEPWTLPDDVSIALFRIAQESLTNAAKYAQAKNVRLHLWLEAGQVNLHVQDDGRGFATADVRPKAHGLAGMRQRMEGLGGMLEVRSAPGQGTKVQASLPLAAADVVQDADPEESVSAQSHG
jgi:signal transduction histidine kinase